MYQSYYTPKQRSCLLKHSLVWKETDCFITLGASYFFPERLFFYVSSGVTSRIYQVCTYFHVQVCMQARMGTHMFVSLTFAFVITALWGLDVEVGSVVSYEIRKVVNCPQMVNP